MNFIRDRSIYLQISDDFCDKILTREWKPGDRIPSVRDMAATFQVNPNTMMRAYTLLQEKGIIVIRRGIGFFVSEDAYAYATDLRKDDFLNRDLPRFFSTLRSLNLNLDDLKNRYEGFSRRQESLSWEK